MRTAAQHYAPEGELQRLRCGAVILFFRGRQTEDVPVRTAVGIVLGENARLVEHQRRQLYRPCQQGAQIHRGMKPANRGQRVGSRAAPLPHHVIAAVLLAFETVGRIGQREITETDVQIGEAAENRKADFAEIHIGVDILGGQPVSQPGEHPRTQEHLDRHKQQGPYSGQAEQHFPYGLHLLLSGHDSLDTQNASKYRNFPCSAIHLFRWICNSAARIFLHHSCAYVDVL